MWIRGFSFCIVYSIVYDMKLYMLLVIVAYEVRCPKSEYKVEV